MPIEITNAQQQTWLVIGALAVALLVSLRASRHTDVFPVSVTQELKGLAILTIVLAHIAYMLVTDSSFLYPLSVAAGVGVDLFLFISGYGLVVGMLRSPLTPVQFYRRRLSRVFIPFWFVIVLLFIADMLVLGRSYDAGYVARSLLGWFPRASAWEDVNSPFWYITWILMFYLLFPLVFSGRRPWLSALVLAAIANALAAWNPLEMQANWLHRLHTNAFSLGMLMAWALDRRPDIRARLIEFRDARGGWLRLAVVTIALAIALWLAPQGSATAWPTWSAALETAGFNPGYFIGQAVSISTLAALVVAFVLKRRDSVFLYWFGVYSYETYLLHWPLMSRYDVFYGVLPAGVATVAWLTSFIALGWLLRKALDPIEALVDKRPKSTKQPTVTSS
jgi:peptidoglycan/LPS O-acetylase OafA/YrhL